MIKKIAVLCTVLLSANSAVFAADWIRLNVTDSGKYIYLDHDSVTKNENNLFYTIRYKDKNNNEKVAYIKYSILEDKVGVIKMKEFKPEKYFSQKVWSESYAFMKKVDDDSLFKNINTYVTDDKMVQELATKRQLRKQSTAKSAENEVVKKYDHKYPGMQKYVAEVEQEIYKNWKLPITNNGGIAKVQFKISNEGKLLSCEIKESSGDKANDDSALQAVKNIEEFAKFPDTVSKDLKEITIIMKFDYYVLNVNKKIESTK